MSLDINISLATYYYYLALGKQPCRWFVLTHNYIQGPIKADQRSAHALHMQWIPVELANYIQWAVSLGCGADLSESTHLLVTSR